VSASVWSAQSKYSRGAVAKVQAHHGDPTPPGGGRVHLLQKGCNGFLSREMLEEVETQMPSNVRVRKLDVEDVGDDHRCPGLGAVLRIDD
jgi:hypothetical protein